MTAKALEGVKVLDLSRVLAGPWCTQILADFGADVIKIEEPQNGDDTRRWGPPNLPPQAGQDTPGASAYYLSCNRNKRSLAINIAAPEGASIIRQLAAKADVVVENFKLHGLDKYGLDYASLCALNPRLVYCSITGFGQTGPYAERPGYDFLAQAMGGVMSITGDPDGPPTKPGVSLADVSTGLYATISIMMALRHAERTGQGQHIDCSLLDSTLAVLANQALSYLVSGVTPVRMGNRHPTVLPYGVFEAKDGSIVIAVGNDRQFAILCDVLGLAEMARDPRFATNTARIRNRDALDEALQAAFGRFAVADLKDVLSAKGVPSGPVNTIEQIFKDPFAAARRVVHHFTREDGVSIPSVAFPSKLSATPAQMVRAPPGLGQHTREALDDWLDLPPTELDSLIAKGVIVQN
jgi:crotonobetainyl-CoA:carnitine CoA-transferase CaiB-like acyl-CoA transferase